MLTLLGDYDRVAARLDDFAAGSFDAMDENQGRRRIWAANVAAIEDGWLSGAGAGSHREIYRTYMSEWTNIEFTHAESGYLQLFTENGIAGLALALAAIALVACWSLKCLRHARAVDEITCFAAVTGGLAASIIHSLFDFVWYIPACMSVTVILAACLLRLAQCAAPRADERYRVNSARGLAALRWPALAVAAGLAGGWAAFVFLGPAAASLHWDAYLRTSVANRKLGEQNISKLMADRPAEPPAAAEALSDAMLRQLERVLACDPSFARAHLQLADKCIARFELAQPAAENAMSLVQVREAVSNGGFDSDTELHAWLRRALGANIELLYRARAAARRAVELCPMQAEGYLYLAKLSFLDGDRPANAEAYVRQALRVRPHDADVLYSAGEQAFMRGDLPAALLHWTACFVHPGTHQTSIVYRLAGRIPASDFLQIFHPDWHTLRDVWARYRALGSDSDRQLLIAYADELARRQTMEAGTARPELIWAWLSAMYGDLGRSAEALACLEQAHTANPRQYVVRQALATALLEAGRLSEAETHLRWCLARRPGDKSLRSALASIPKRRLAQHISGGAAAPSERSLK
jgi:tetratricopeptide (TPR) repeat protein